MAETVAGDEFAFTTEHDELRSAVRGFCADRSTEATVRRLMESTPPFDTNDWARLGSELGVLGLGVPEELGGSGGGLVDTAIMVEELGAAMFCGPVFGTVMLSIPALVAAPVSEVRDELLGSLVDGSRVAAFAAPDRGGRLDPAAVTVTAAESGDGWTVSGVAPQVVDGADADVLLVAATTPDGVSLFAVDAAESSVEATRLVTMDQTRQQARTVFASSPARLVAGVDAAITVCDSAFRTACVLLAAEQIGGSQHLLDLCVEYAKSRLQFGRPIGSFQAVKHRIADMLVEQEHARSAAYHGAWALQDGTDDPDLESSIAQAVCSESSPRIARDSVQVHGGIGFTWEHRIHLYLKRAFTDAALLGSAEQHRDRVAAAVIDAAEAAATQVAAG